MDINTYNESSLHKTLKTLYASENGFQTEVKKDGYIYDILDADGNAIEIQTKNLSKLLPKIKKTIKRGKKITVVRPLAVQKTITLTDTEGKIIAKRKSPKKESIYSLFRELTGLHPVLLDEHFSLEVLLVTITEKRMRTDTDVQSKNGRRRFKKNWLKTDNELQEIRKTVSFSNAIDYLKHIPKTILPNVTAKSLAEELRRQKDLPSSASTYAHLVIWVLVRMKLIEHTGLQEKSRLYKINDNFIQPEAYGKFY